MIRINKGVKFKVWDEDEEVMHEAEEVCRIHFDNGAPYAVTLWEGDALFNFVLYLDYANEKGGEKNGYKNTSTEDRRL